MTNLKVFFLGSGCLVPAGFAATGSSAGGQRSDCRAGHLPRAMAPGGRAARVDGGFS